MSDERALVERLRTCFRTDAPHVRVGVGDDAAVVRIPNDAVLTVDVSVEGVHFWRGFAPLDVLAERAFHAAASDIAAMGATPSCALVSLILPRLDDATIDTLLLGLSRASIETGIPIVGGNTSRGDALSVSTTVVGSASAPILRSGARVGDTIYVTGPTGDRALGLALLLSGGVSVLPEALRETGACFVRAWCEPRARIREGLALSGLATSAIDLSDGLAKDLHRLVEASGVGAQLDAESLVYGGRFREVAHAIGTDALELATSGGEAYELLFTAPANVALPVSALAIGEITSPRDVTILDGGVLRPLPPLGFDHVSSR